MSKSGPKKMGGYPGEPIVITKILISGRQKGQSQRRGCEKTGEERWREMVALLAMSGRSQEMFKKKKNNLKSVCLYI